MTRATQEYRQRDSARSRPGPMGLASAGPYDSHARVAGTLGDILACHRPDARGASAGCCNPIALARSPVARIACAWHPCRCLYWQHALSARALGLKPLWKLTAAPAVELQVEAAWSSWARDIGQVALFAAGIAAVVVMGDRAARRVGKMPALLSGKRSWLIASRESIIHQVRWAFYREPFVFVWGPAIGSWLGTLPVFIRGPRQSGAVAEPPS